MSQLEAVLGSRARSGQQLNAWDAAYGPIDSSGYPQRIWFVNGNRDQSTRFRQSIGGMTRDTT